MAEEHVLTPGGYRPKSLVHHIEPGHAIVARGGRLRKVHPQLGEVADLGPVEHRDTKAALMPANVTHTAPGAPAPAVPALGSGWIVFTSWSPSPGQHVTSFKTTWVVPQPPAGNDGQTVFLFNGIQNS